MGLRHDGIARIWQYTDKGRYGSAQISTQKFDKNANKYTNDFSSFVNMVGTAHDLCGTIGDIEKGKSVPIRLSDFEVTTYYNAETKKKSTNISVFAFHFVEWDDENKKYINVDAEEEIADDDAGDEDVPF